MADPLRDPIIVVDTREQRPLPFPRFLRCAAPAGGGTRTVRVHTLRRALSEGDYLLEGEPTGTIVERKGSLREVAQNCLSGDLTRFTSALSRLAEACDRPVLLLEGSVADLSPRNKGDDFRPGVDKLIRMTNERGVSLLVLPAKTLEQRRHVGEWVARLLINGALDGNAERPGAHRLQRSGDGGD